MIYLLRLIRMMRSRLLERSEKQKVYLLIMQLWKKQNKAYCIPFSFGWSDGVDRKPARRK